ncbi:MAG: radical SAM protein [Anaerolineae bacterium]|nr:radical SAM protein [Anaerolineae bacterium]
MEHQAEIPPFVLYPGAPFAHLGQCQCDCACALDLELAAAILSGSDVCIQQPGVQSWPLYGGWQATFNPAGPVGVAALSPAAQRVLAAFDCPVSVDEVSTHASDMVPALVRQAAGSLMATGLLRPAETVSIVTQPSTLSAWLHVTEACNLACPYCYVHKQPTTMTAAAGLYAVDRLVTMARQYGYRTLRLKYAGGEPTLAFGLVEVIHRHAARSATAAGLLLDEVILSNGVGVTDATLKKIADAQMGLMVSLDGGQAAHDRLRSARGQGTYEEVVRTIERAIAHGLRPDISITLTALNLDGAAEAAAFALARDLPFSLNFYRECARECSAGALSSLVVEPARLIEAVLGVLRIIDDYPDYSVPVSGILDRVRLDVPHRYACSAGRGYVAVDANGRVSPCQMLLDTPWSHLAADDPLGAIRERGMDLFTPVEQQAECEGCPWQSACAGGCPLLRGTPLHDAYCQVYKALLPELARLEARRLIRLYATTIE